jgi:hypothetical protein
MESPLELRLAIVAAIATGAMVMYLVALMIAARIYGRLRRLRRANFVDSWQEYLASDTPPVTARILSLHLPEVHHLLRGWNLAAEKEDESGLERLRAIAYASGLTHAAVAFAFRGTTRDERISGLQALGKLGRIEVLERIVPLIEHEDRIISLAAFEAVVRIDQTVIRHRLGQILCSHSSWPEHSVAGCIQELDQASKAQLVRQVARADVACVNRIVAPLEQTHHAGATELIRYRLQTADSREDRAAMLYAVQNEEHIQQIEASLESAPGGRA